VNGKAAGRGRRLLDRCGGRMLSNGFWPGGENENTLEFAGCGGDGVYSGGQCVCAAGGTSGKCGRRTCRRWQIR